MKTSIKIGLSLGMLLLLATAAAGQAVNSDSWAATDALGRKVREYKNAGDKKKDKFVGIFYLTWHMGRNDTTSQVKNITEIVRQHPEAMKDYNHPAWGTSKPGIFFWDEPLFGPTRGCCANTPKCWPTPESTSFSATAPTGR